MPACLDDHTLKIPCRKVWKYCQGGFLMQKKDNKIKTNKKKKQKNRNRFAQGHLRSEFYVEISHGITSS
jgi:ribosomal protein L21